MAELYVKKDSIKANYEKMYELCNENGTSLNVVSKFCLSNPEIIKHLYNSSKNPCKTISDSNMVNFSYLQEELSCNITKCLIKTKISDIQKIPALPKNARPTRLFVSDKNLLLEIAKLPEDLDIEVVLIAETGDMKDGFVIEDILQICNEFKNINIIGISVNFSCLSGILPDLQTVKELAEVAKKVQQIRNLNKPFLSVGGTVVHELLEKNELKGLVQEVRCGEGIFFGFDSSGNKELKNFCKQTIILRGEIIEVSQKDFSLRNGKTSGFTATGSKVENKIEQGKRLRAVLDFGILGASQNDLVPVDKEIYFAGQTFDFTVVDITDSKNKYIAGNRIDFITNYGAASFCMMNRFIPCILVEE